MDVIHIILYIIAAIAIFYVVLFLGLALFALWPIVIGVVGFATAGILWDSGHDNIAVILCILSIGGPIYWFIWGQGALWRKNKNILTRWQESVKDTMQTEKL